MLVLVLCIKYLIRANAAFCVHNTLDGDDKRGFRKITLDQP